MKQTDLFPPVHIKTERCAWLPVPELQEESPVEKIVVLVGPGIDEFLIDLAKEKLFKMLLTADKRLLEMAEIKEAWKPEEIINMEELNGKRTNL